MLVPILAAPSGARVLLTERAHHLVHHPGQVSFPGGSAEAGDGSVAATALREAHEEVGLAPEAVEVIGYLPPQWTVSGFAMTPVIGLVTGEAAADSGWRIDPQEVAGAFTVPATFLFDEDNHQSGTREVDGVAVPTVEILWQQHRIWGVTARVISLVTSIISENYDAYR